MNLSCPSEFGHLVRERYTPLMTGIFIPALIAMALWTGSRVIGSLNNS